MEEPLILDRYRPLEFKGEGGSGSVEICWDTRIQRRVAIKRMPLASADDMGSSTVPGLSEARTAAMLSHPNIVSVIDFETTDDEALLIMEAIEGPTLAGLIDETPAGELDLDIIASVTESVAAALDFAHENQVLHLDVKPENILITQGGIVKVSDFGISELADARGFGEASGGTIGYMPPEQMEGLDLDQRCDEFALATVVYEMLTGRNPFMAPTMEASLKLMRGFEPIAPSSLRDDVAPELNEALLAAMSPERDARFETVYDFERALDGLLGDAKAGAAKLKALVQPDDEDVDESSSVRHHLQFSHPSQRASAVLGRLLCAGLSWWVALLGLGASGAFTIASGAVTSTPPSAAALALIAAAAGAVKPVLGSFLAFCCLGVGFVASPGYPTPLGVALIVFAVLWVACCRDQQTADANCTLAAAPLNSTLLDLLPCLFMGVFLPPKRALFAALGGILVQWATSYMGPTIPLVLFLDDMTASGTGIMDIFYGDLASPFIWIGNIGWVISAILVSSLCSRQTRLSSMVGVTAGAAILIATRTLATWSLTGTWSAPEAAWIVSVLVAWLIAIVACAFGASRREEGES